jgi:hypothetical protein
MALMHPNGLLESANQPDAPLKEKNTIVVRCKSKAAIRLNYLYDNRLNTGTFDRNPFKTPTSSVK